VARTSAWENAGRRPTPLVLTLCLTLPLAAANVDGAKVHWTSAGDPNRLAVVFVHGWTCDETSWQNQVPVISKEYRVITLDLPGHGKSDPPRDGRFTLDLFAGAIEAVRKEARANRVVLVGHSMGVPVARHYARLFPARTVALVLVDGALLTPAEAASRAGFPQRMAGPEGRKYREQVIQTMFSSATTPEEKQHILSMMLAAPETTAVGAMHVMLEPAATGDYVLRVPALGIFAGPESRAYMTRLFPLLDFHQVQGSGHFIMMDKPEEFNRLLLEFLGKLK
jgi:pimeloyl-ACP methyl ester carboxylesterase